MNNKLQKEIHDTLKDYQKLYPDTTVTTMTVLDDHAPRDGEVFPIVMKLAKMTKSMPLYYQVYRSRKSIVIMVLKSRKFLENCDKMKVGTKVRYEDPRVPDKHPVGEITKEGVEYVGGAACISLKCEEAGITEEDDSFAVWWKPVEE